MRHCKICSHLERDKINELILERKSFRDISEQFGGSFKHAAVGRHIVNCLNLSVSIVERERLVEQGINFHERLVKTAVRVDKLIEAVENWLRDPDDPEQFTVDPRDSEINVVYDDHTDCTERGNPKRKRDTLRRLLARVERGNFEIVQVNWKQADNRQLFLNSLETVTRQLKLYGDAAGIFQKPRENEETLNNICQVIRDAAAAGENSDAIVSTAAEMYKINKNIILRHYNLNFAPVQNGSELNN